MNASFKLQWMVANFRFLEKNGVMKTRLFLWIAASSLAPLLLAQEEKPAFSSAVIHESAGNVTLCKNLERTVPAGKGDLIEPKDFVITSSKSFVQFEFENQCLVRLGSNTTFSFDAASRALMIEQGEAVLVIPKSETKVRVSTPLASATSSGATIYMTVSPEATEYYCFEGRCNVGSNALVAGDRITIKSRDDYFAPISVFIIKEQLASNMVLTVFSQPLPSLAKVEDEIRKQEPPKAE
jgi:hypothetical protein